MNKKQIISVIFMIILYIALMGYISGVIVQAYISTIAWQNQPMVEGIKFDIKFGIADVLNVLVTKEGLIAWLAITTFTAAIVYLIILNRGGEARDEQNFKYSGEGTYGTAEWMNDKERNKVFKIENIKKAEGIILGKTGLKSKNVVTIPHNTYYNKHILVLGGSGSGKSRKYVRNNIISLSKANQSMIVTDPKGELYRDTAKMLENEGYTVKIFNLVNPIHSDRWNPLSEVVDDLSAQLFSEVVITNTRTSVKVGGDPFWDRAEMNLLKALALYVTKEYRKDNKATMESLYSLLSCGSSSEIDKTFKNLPLGHPAKAPYNIYAQSNDNVRTGVVIGLGTRLQVFQNKIIQGLTEVNDIDLLEPGKSKCAYFCIMSDTDSTLNFLSSLFFSFLFIDLVKYADSTVTGKCNPEVNFLLDEFSNIGEIPDFTKKISTIRSRALHCSIIIQSIPQIQNRYPLNGWQEIMGNCDTKLVLGCGEKLSAEYVSELLGQATIRVTSRQKKLGLDEILDYGRETKSVGKRSLLNPDEVMKMSSDKCIAMLRGEKPLRLYKMDYTEHPKSKEMIIMPYSQYMPAWSKKWQKEKGLNQEEEQKVQEKNIVNKEAEGTKAKDKKDEIKANKEKSKPMQNPKEEPRLFHINEKGADKDKDTETDAMVEKKESASKVFYINEEAAMEELEKQVNQADQNTKEKETEEEYSNEYLEELDLEEIDI